MVALDRINRMSLEWIYLFIAFIIGGLLVLITPPYEIPDEVNHFARAYQISEGYIRSPVTKWKTGELYFVANVPATFKDIIFGKKVSEQAKTGNIQLIRRNYTISSYSNESLTLPITNTGQYSPINYIPQILGIWIGKLLNFSAGGIFYTMRWLASIFVISCVFFSARILKEKKNLIIILASMPMVLAESSSCSADAVTYGVAFLTTSFLFSLKLKESELTKRELGFLIITAITLGLIKQVYGVILLLYFLLPISRMRTKIRFYIGGIILLVIYAGSALLWLSMMSSGNNVALPLCNGADVGRQLAFVAENPCEYIQALISTLMIWGESYCYQFIGVLGLLQIHLPRWFYYLYAFFILLGSVWGELRMTIYQRLGCWLAVFLVAIVIFFNQYLTWSSVGASMIDGVQGRYMIPLAVLFFGSFSYKKHFKYGNLVTCVAVLLSGIITIFATLDYFYE